MFGFMLFLHLTGLSLWLGSLLGTVVMLGLFRKQGGSETNALAGRTIGIFSKISHPSAFVVLVSGVLMIVQMGLGAEKPLWLQVMEKGGGMIVLLALIVTGIMGSKVKKRLKSGQPAAWTGYVTVMNGFIVSIVLVVLAVSLKI